MIATEELHDVHVSALKVGVGFAGDADPRRAMLEASETARSGLRGARPHMALVVTAGLSGVDALPLVRGVLGPVGIAGGATTRLMTEAGFASHGAIVIAMATEGDATNGVAAVCGRRASEAGQSAARIVMAGWPFRLRYPRGLGVAFTALGMPHEFLDGWRQFMGPKMRTICGLMPGGVIHGAATTSAGASVACLEASYATGLGCAEGFASDAAPDREVLIHGAAEAANTAVKRLNERSARLMLVLDTADRQAALGDAALEGWQRLRAEAGEGVACVGWVCERVDGYGRGIQPLGQSGSLVIAAVGDGPSTGA